MTFIGGEGNPAHHHSEGRIPRVNLTPASGFDALRATLSSVIRVPLAFEQCVIYLLVR